jgi:SAM-dependent methyltransferase
MGYLERVFRSTEAENRRVILETLPRACGGDLLDLGTHEGDFTVRVAERVGARKAFGVELIPEHASLARAKGIEVVGADLAEGLPFDDGRFRVVHANQVIEHLQKTDVFVSEIRRVLAPDGIACISTNNLASWHNVVSLALGFQPPPMHVSDEVILGNPLDPLRGQPHEDRGRTHMRLFTARALSELCEHHGLTTVETRTAGYYPFPPGLGRLVRRLDPLHGAFLVGLFTRRD